MSLIFDQKFVNRIRQLPEVPLMSHVARHSRFEESVRPSTIRPVATVQPIAFGTCPHACSLARTSKHIRRARKLVSALRSLQTWDDARTPWQITGRSTPVYVSLTLIRTREQNNPQLRPKWLLVIAPRSSRNEIALDTMCGIAS